MSARETTIYGMCAAEREVMERWDAGLGSKAIAAQTGLKHARVMQIISYLNKDDSDFENGIRLGSRMLAEKLAGYRGARA